MEGDPWLGWAQEDQRKCQLTWSLVLCHGELENKLSRFGEWERRPVRRRYFEKGTFTTEIPNRK